MPRAMSPAHAPDEGRAAPSPPARVSTRERILRAFLQVANERGLEAATTRAIAQAAGVNEVTLFRQFGDKANLALEAVRHFDPIQRLRESDPGIDISSPERAAAGLQACLRSFCDQVRSHPELLQFGIGETRRLPEVGAAIAEIPRAALDFLGRALEQAAPLLRPEVDPEATRLQWLGFVVEMRLLVARGVIEEPDDRRLDELLAAVVRVVIDWRGKRDDD
jgi:AcrR family transcriptional regulator